MKCWMRLAFMVLSGVLVTHAWGVDRFWTAGTGPFLTPGNWSGGATPVVGDNAFIDNGGTARLTSGVAEPSNLFLASAGGTSGNYEQTAGDLFTDKMTVGEVGSASATFSGGEIHVGNGSLFVGGENGLGTGTLTINGAGTMVSSGDDIQFGRVGVGTLNFSAGRMRGGYTVVAKFGSATWNQSGGVFDQDFGDVEIGDGGRPDQSGTPGVRTGVINLTGGVIQTADGFAIGNRVGGGTVNISGGGLAVTGGLLSTLWVGRGMNWEGNVGAGAATTLRVTGGQSVIAVNEAFLMNPEQVSSSSTLIAEITGAAHTTIQVAGDANIVNGNFKVELNGYVPHTGDSWTIIKARADLTTALAQIDGIVSAGGYTPLDHFPVAGFGSVVGPFASTDLTAPLPSGLSWAVSYTETEVRLSVTGTLLGDFDNNGAFNCADVNSLVVNIAGGTNPVAFDLTGDGLVNTADLSAWLANAGSVNLANRQPYRPGDANLDGVVDGSDFGIWNANKFTNTPAWCSGDFNANGSIDGSDFGIWNANKFTASDASAVPEPTLGWFALLALSLGLGRRARR